MADVILSDDPTNETAAILECWATEHLTLEFYDTLTHLFRTDEEGGILNYWQIAISYLKGFTNQDAVVTPHTLPFILLSIVKLRHTPTILPMFEDIAEKLSVSYSEAKKDIDYQYCLKLSAVVNILQSFINNDPLHLHLNLPHR